MLNISYYSINVLADIYMSQRRLLFQRKTENEQRLITRLKNDLIELTEEEFNQVSNTVTIPMQTRAYNKYRCHTF